MYSKTTKKRIEKIHGICCEYFDLDINKRSNKEEYVDARKCFILLCKNILKISLQDIGGMLDNRTHATVINSYNNGLNDYENVDYFRDNYNELNVLIRGEGLFDEVIELEKLKSEYETHMINIKRYYEKKIESINIENIKNLENLSKQLNKIIKQTR